MEIGYLLTDQSAAISALAKSTAQITAVILSVLGEVVHVDGVTIYSTVLNLEIVPECIAITPTMVFASAVIAFPATMSDKLKGLVIGTVLLYGINLVRVVTLFYIGVYAPTHLEFAHLVVWQAAIMLAAIGIWIHWAVKYGQARLA